MTHPEQPVLSPGSIFAGYTIEGVVDRGGMGVVYRAQDPDLDRRVALKVIAPEHAQDPTAVARFKSEARLAASLEHPNIVAIHRGGELDGVLYLAMQFIPGTNLRRIIEQGTLDLPRIADITTQVASALDAAHARGLVHRDVKPGNILVTGEGDHEHVYLTDFGLTKRLGTGGDLTRPGGWVGTPDYVAPEQIQARDIDGRADVYSLGCVVYEMLTGEVTFPNGTEMAKLWAHVTDPPPLPRTRRPDLVEDFDALVARATAKEPQDRFPSAGALAAAVRDAVAKQEAARKQGAMPDTVGGDLFPPTVIGSTSSAVPPAPAVSAGSGDAVARRRGVPGGVRARRTPAPGDATPQCAERAARRAGRRRADLAVSAGAAHRRTRLRRLRGRRRDRPDAGWVLGQRQGRSTGGVR